MIFPFSLSHTCKCTMSEQSYKFNPYMTNGHAHHYNLGEPTFNFRGIRSYFRFLFYFSMKFLLANRIAPDGTPRSAASHVSPMFH